MQLYAVETA